MTKKNNQKTSFFLNEVFFIICMKTQKIHTIYIHYNKEWILMHKNAVGTFLKGMGAGVVASCVAGASVYMMSSGKGKTKKKISSAVKTAAEFMDNMSYMLK